MAAIAHPKSSLTRIAAVVDDLTDERATSAMLESLPAGEHVFDDDIYSAPLVDRQFVRSRAETVLISKSVVH